MKTIAPKVFAILLTSVALSSAGDGVVCKSPQKNNEVRVERLDYERDFVITILAPPNTITMHYSGDDMALSSILVETPVEPSKTGETQKSVLIDLRDNKVSGFATYAGDERTSTQRVHAVDGDVIAYTVTDQDQKSDSYLKEHYFDIFNNEIPKPAFYKLYDSPQRWLSLFEIAKEP